MPHHRMAEENLHEDTIITDSRNHQSLSVPNASSLTEIIKVNSNLYDKYLHLFNYLLVYHVGQIQQSSNFLLVFVYL